MMYGFEYWVLNKKQEIKIKVLQKKMPRWMYSLRLDRVELEMNV